MNCQVFFVANAENALCLICRKSIPVIKDYNLRRRYEKSHEAYQPLVGKKRTQKIEKLRKEFLAQQLMFKKSNQKSQASTHASYVVGTCGQGRQVRPCLTSRIVQRKTKINYIIKIKWFHTNQNIYQNLY